MTITMYGADWCGHCLRAKAYFADRDVADDYVDLETHPEAVDVVLERNNGLKRIPVIVFDDDTHLTEPSNEALAAKLAEPAAMAAPSPVFEVLEDAEAGRFDLRRDGTVVSFATYHQQGATVIVPHVETIAEHRGQGYAARLMDGLVDLLRSSNRTITPLCPFAAGHIRDNPEHHDLLASR